ncbi:MAG: glutamine synthetase type III, partial [Erysipelotrichaceae bacterium]|nr:glutamine synthetase type III [Erysipelotrichaceae bacterium]
VLNTHAKRIVKLFGESNEVFTTVGTEQEYFLIDKSVYEQREDLINCGRTLFGAKMAKGQELDDHYFANIPSRVAKYMASVNEKLWAVGIYSKTEHNEVAPAQHELASVYTYANVATDNNQLVMSIMKETALEYDMICLLHEKPFEYINGSGKHNNWSLATKNENLLEPGKNPQGNIRFLLLITAIIKAVDLHSDLLRLSIASASNDNRLGANEAPPAIVSIFLGDELTSILSSIESGKDYHAHIKEKIKLHVPFIPELIKDTSDRNRTSPFAFTGNKFEFRMVGSMQSIATPNMVLNTIVASVLDEFATILEHSSNVTEAALNIIKEEYGKHKRVVYNGNGYSTSWVKEAKERGLYNLKDTMEAIPCMLNSKNVDLFEKYHIFSKRELMARQEVIVENYYKSILIEAETMIDMLNRTILPGVFKYKSFLADEINKIANLSLKHDLESEKLKKISTLCEQVHLVEKRINAQINKCYASEDVFEKASIANKTLLSAMKELRTHVDELETLVAKKYWGIPSYFDILNSVRY